ncbi:acetate-CoA ligase [Cryptococcus sp. DSM 104548]
MSGLLTKPPKPADQHLPQDISYPPLAAQQADGRPVPHIGPGLEAYRQEWGKTVGPGSDEWWREKALSSLTWYEPFLTVRGGGFENGDVHWFTDGVLNACYNALDRHYHTDPFKTAIIYEADEPSDSREISFSELFSEVNRLANVLKSYGAKRGDVVIIYMPMTWQIVAAFLACARIGAVHCAVFAGFSAESLSDRINDSQSRIILTADEGLRGGKIIPLKEIVDAALRTSPAVGHVLVYQRTGARVSMIEGRDRWWHDELEIAAGFCPCERMNSEDPLFMIYTSGSTGKPKGVVHTTAGYLLCAYLAVKYTFDVHPGDRYGCFADVGWVLGHTHIVYGPLLLGVTTTVFESIPTYPTPSRFWDVVDKWRITQIYTAPTAIRLLRSKGDEYVDKHNLSSLRVLGTAGEPINPEAWLWYHNKVGRGKCAVVDTYWMTETGSAVISPLPGAIPTKAGSATFPFFGHELEILEAKSGKVLHGNEVEGVLVSKRHWPSLARTIFGDHKRYLDTYMRPYPGYFFFGDGAYRDKDGYLWIQGRVDDVINVSGHRMSTAEVESALLTHPSVAETAVVGVPDPFTGQSLHAFITLKPQPPSTPSISTQPDALAKVLTAQVRSIIGPFAAPKRIYVIPEQPKTRSGKIMRRILRKVVVGETDELGDLSSIGDPGVIDAIIRVVADSSPIAQARL